MNRPTPKSNVTIFLTSELSNYDHSLCDDDSNRRKHVLRQLHVVLARPSIDGEQARDLTHALELRLDDLLTRQLHSELVQREGGSHQHPPVTNARSIQLLLECLQCLWSYADTKRRLQAFSHLGSYLPWFLRAWNSYPHDVDIPRIVAQILQLWSSTKNATINAELLRSGVVDRFRQAMAWEIPPCHPVHAFILTTLKNLTLRSTEGDNIRMHTDLYNLVVRHAVDGTQSKPVADFISHYTNQNPFLHTHSQDTHRRRSERSERLILDKLESTRSETRALVLTNIKGGKLNFLVEWESSKRIPVR